MHTIRVSIVKEFDVDVEADSEDEALRKAVLMSAIAVEESGRFAGANTLQAEINDQVSPEIKQQPINAGDIVQATRALGTQILVPHQVSVTPGDGLIEKGEEAEVVHTHWDGINGHYIIFEIRMLGDGWHFDINPEYVKFFEKVR